MFDWANNFGTKYAGIIAVAGFVLAVVVRFRSIVQSLYRSRLAIRRSFDRLVAWAISPEYRRAHRDRSIRKLSDKLQRLQDFGERDKLEIQTKLYRQLSNGLFYLTFLLFLGGLVGFLMCLAFVVTLERVILKQPVHNFPMPWSFRVGLPLSFGGFFSFVLFSFGSVGLQADKLSPKSRERRINRLKKKLREFGVEAPG